MKLLQRKVELSELLHLVTPTSYVRKTGEELKKGKIPSVTTNQLQSKEDAGPFESRLTVAKEKKASTCCGGYS